MKPSASGTKSRPRRTQRETCKPGAASLPKKVWVGGIHQRGERRIIKKCWFYFVDYNYGEYLTYLKQLTLGMVKRSEKI